MIDPLAVRRDNKYRGLEKFGLTPSALNRLGSRPVDFSIHLTGRKLPGLIRDSPIRREAVLRAALSAQYKRLAARFPEASLKSRGKRKASWDLDGRLPAREIRALANRREVQYVRVGSVRGRRPRPLKLDRGRAWFCVWGNVAIQIEGRVRGSVTLEDRLVLVRAHDPNDACRRLRREWRNYAKPYLNPYGYLVRWQLISVRDVYGITEDPLDPRGTEVYSRLRTERMKPEYRWLPRKRGA
jgi:hypothetical protein